MTTVLDTPGSATRRADLPAAVTIREVGPRDGLQLEVPLSIGQRLAMIAALVDTGVRHIEVAAFVSEQRVPSMAGAAELAKAVRQWPGVEWSALVAGVGGAARAVEAGLTSLQYVVSASEGHSLANTGRTTQESVALIERVADLAHRAGGHCDVIVATAWDCPFDGPTPVTRTVDVARQAVESGARMLSLADTIGTTVPTRTRQLIDAVRASVPTADLGVHMHNTRGTGLASAWEAVTAGVTTLDASMGGFGGCPFAPGASGNIATEDLVYLLHESGIATGVDLDACLAATLLIEALVGHAGDAAVSRAGGRSSPRQGGPADGTGVEARHPTRPLPTLREPACPS